MKIAELLQSYDEIARTRKYNMAKKAFIANPNVPPPQPGQPVQQALPQGQQDPQQQQMMQQAAQPQADPAQAQQASQAAQPQPDPAQAQQPQAPQGDANSNGTLMDEVMSAAQQLPPEAQQQVAPILQQLQQMPADQREQQLSQILSEISGGQPQQAPPEQQAQQPQQAPPAQQAQPMIAPAADEMPPEMMQDPSAMPQDPGAYAPVQDPTQQAEEDAAQAENSAIEAKNELDNVRVSLSVRELLDLVGKGSATASLLKVKQLADTHQQKMEQTRQKAESDQQKAQADQQQQQQGLMGDGGIYSSPMGGAAGAQ